jgi:hypothetical protein
MFTLGMGGRLVGEVREKVEGQKSTRGVENTNMTDCISSLYTIFRVWCLYIVPSSMLKIVRNENLGSLKNEKCGPGYSITQTLASLYFFVGHSIF